MEEGDVVGGDARFLHRRANLGRRVEIARRRARLQEGVKRPRVQLDAPGLHPREGVARRGDVAHLGVRGEQRHERVKVGPDPGLEHVAHHLLDADDGVLKLLRVRVPDPGAGPGHVPGRNRTADAKTAASVPSRILRRVPRQAPIRRLRPKQRVEHVRIGRHPRQLCSLHQVANRVRVAARRVRVAQRRRRVPDVPRVRHSVRAARVTVHGRVRRRLRRRPRVELVESDGRRGSGYPRRAPRLPRVPPPSPPSTVPPDPHRPPAATDVPRLEQIRRYPRVRLDPSTEEPRGSLRNRVEVLKPGVASLPRRFDPFRPPHLALHQHVRLERALGRVHPHRTHDAPALVKHVRVGDFAGADENRVEESRARVTLRVRQVLVPLALRQHLEPLPRAVQLAAAVVRDDDLAVRVVRRRVPQR